MRGFAYVDNPLTTGYGSVLSKYLEISDLSESAKKKFKPIADLSGFLADGSNRLDNPNQVEDNLYTLLDDIRDQLKTNPTGGLNLSARKELTNSKGAYDGYHFVNQQASIGASDSKKLANLMYEYMNDFKKGMDMYGNDPDATRHYKKKQFEDNYTFLSDYLGGKISSEPPQPSTPDIAPTLLDDGNNDLPQINSAQGGGITEAEAILRGKKRST